MYSVLNKKWVVRTVLLAIKTTDKRFIRRYKDNNGNIVTVVNDIQMVGDDCLGYRLKVTKDSILEFAVRYEGSMLSENGSWLEGSNNVTLDDADQIGLDEGELITALIERCDELYPMSRNW